METRDAYGNQFTIINTLLHGFVDSLRPGEWQARPVPSANTVGFTVWHIPAVQDWAISTFIGGGLGLNMAPEWAAKGFAVSPAAFGMSSADADAVSARVTPTDVLDYADAVLERARAWLATTGPGEFERAVPDSRKHLSLHPVYATPGYLEEAEGMLDYPLWRIMSGPCYGHARGHFGELELALQIIREGRDAS